MAAQARLQQVVTGFRFVLGFSGWYYLNGNEEEDDGDRKLIGKKVFVCVRKVYMKGKIMDNFPNFSPPKAPRKFAANDILKCLYQKIR